MARTPLSEGLQRAFADVRAGEEGRTSRRAFLRDAGALGAAASVFGIAAGRARAAAPAGRVVVVGAGLAGLTAAYRLKQAGIAAEVHEASTRVGGRCWTLRGFFADGQIVERGGELIDQGHTNIRLLSKELGLTLDNLLAAEQNGTEQTNWFDGARYSYEEATADLKASWQKIHKDVSAASYPTTFELSTPRGRELDRMSIVDWIEETFEGGIDSRIGQLLDVAYNIEYGAESDEQSSLNLLYLLAYSGQGNLRIFGPSNEKYHVRGGNDRIVTGLVERLDGQLVTNAALAAIERTPAGAYLLSFAGRQSPVTADRVVLAIPFSVMRATVDFSNAGFSPLKQKAIAELGMGTNAKLNVQFARRHWATLGCNGDSYADTGYQATWEVSRAQAGTPGILVDYTGGDVARAQSGGGAATLAAQFLAQLEPVLPGTTAEWNGLATFDDWLTNPWTLGSYSFWRVGQYTSIAGVEGERSANCHFAGEHTSIDFQGYLNGAVESGERVAAEVFADLRAVT
jgi:monoamine oxidase